MEATVVTLSPSSEANLTVSFEDAFGDFSNLGGRGRERRQKRRMLRIARRRERMQARQELRADRKRRRKARRKIGSDEETGESESEEGGSEEDNAPKKRSSRRRPSSEDSNDGGGSSEGSSQSSDDSGQSSDDSGSADDSGSSSDDSARVDSEQGESDEASGFTGDESGADGMISLSPDDAEWNEYFSSAEGYAKINPNVRAIAKQIEQHKEKIYRMQQRLAVAMKPANGRLVANLRREIDVLKRRLSLLEKKLAGYSTTKGDYKHVQGGRRLVAKRKAEVRHAKLNARKQRKHEIRKHRKETVVEGRLNPKFASQRIVIPAKSVLKTRTQSNADGSDDSIESTLESYGMYGGTGLIGLDSQNDIDAPEARKFDLNYSNADGESAVKGVSKTTIKHIAIGVGLGVLAIVLIKKFGK